ncbi:MAG: aminopeptidase [Bacilli bacterium]|nr:aminopeptidase [Bacilli bacterium]
MNNERFLKLLHNYAKLIVYRGLNLPKGRIIKIDASIDQPEFVNILTEECYKAGAKHVIVKLTSAEVERMIYERTELGELKKLLPYWKEEKKYAIKHNFSSIRLESEDPYYLNGVDAKKISRPNQISRHYVNKLRRASNFYYAPYTIACVPSKAWAKRVFPKLTPEKAEMALWETIFKVSGVTLTDPYKIWDEKCRHLAARAKWLNSLNIKSLHYTNKLGTDLTIGMTERYRFAATADYDRYTHRIYYSNIPSEEAFVSPHRLKTEGVVYASKPLCENGQMIEGICLHFRHGKIVKATAKKNEALLKTLIKTDPNARYLGEAALVPFHSPISQTGILFYNTLFDENASCHFAFGECYSYTYRGHDKMNHRQLKRAGLNFSSTHIDFMIGTPDLNITATTHDGKQVPIFQNGDWAKM